MQFKKVRWKNFLSYPNSWTEYNFQNGLTLIQGPIGSGKSTIIDVLNFALFGSPYRKITIPRLVNTKNKKNLCVELYVQKNGKDIKIVRGISPNIFEIYVDGNLVPLESRKKKYQEVLEELLEIDERVFNQVVVKSLSKGSSFFTLSKQEKRKVIESIFNVEIFGLMIEVLKEKKKELEGEYEKVKNELFLTKNLMKKEEEKIEEIKQVYNEEIVKVYDDKIKLIKSKINELEEKIKEREEKFLKLKEKKEKVENVEKKLLKLEKRISKKKGIEDTLKEVNEIMDEICKECEKKECVLKKISEQWDLHDLEEMKEKRERIKEKLSKKDKLINLYSQMENEIFSFKREKNQLRKELNQLLKEKEQKIEMRNKSIDMNKLEEYQRKIEELNEKIQDLKERINDYEIMIFLCSDDGIKKQLIKQYLPLLNAILVKYFEEFEVNFSIQLDANFDEIIKSRFRENFVYFNFSEGEKRIIDLSMLFAFIEFVERKSNLSGINLLILDEITTGLDRETDEILYKVLRNIAKKKEVIIMSHTNWDITRYDRIFVVKKEKGFSKLNEEGKNESREN